MCGICTEIAKEAKAVKLQKARERAKIEANIGKIREMAIFETVNGGYGTVDTASVSYRELVERGRPIVEYLSFSH